MIPRRTLISAGCASLLLASVVSLSATIGVAPAAASQPATYVATSGVNSSSCGSMHQPCQTISYALGLTPAGGTIEVAPGTYNEQLVINRPVSIINCACCDSSLPRFHVSNRRSCSGSVVMRSLIASRMASAP